MNNLDYCDVFLSAVKTHSDVRIVSDVILHF